VHEATRDPVVGENLAYSVHFYAATHGEELREKVAAAVRGGFLVFASEWGASECTGDGALDLDASRTWLGFLERHQISDVNWAISDKAERCSALRPGASGGGGWPAAHLTGSGEVRGQSLRGELPPLICSCNLT